MIPAIACLSPAGLDLGGRIAAIIGGEVLILSDPKAELPVLFRAGRTIVGICAAAILIRLLAPFLGDKQGEPPVLAVSLDGAHVVPLLGGHRGANRLARRIAEGLGGIAALTTASDSRFSRGLDEPPEGYVLAEPQRAKAAMAEVLAGAEIALIGDAPWLAEAGYPFSLQGKVAVAVTHLAASGPGLVYHPRVLLAGLGCERGTPAAEVVALLAQTLQQAGLAPESLAAIASIDIKADEPALHAAAAHFGVPLRLFSAGELAQEAGRVPNPSVIVEAETGTPSVAEAAAIKAGKLLVPKRKSVRATCAIGIAASPLDPLSLGRAPGILHVVGVGPGAPALRTAAAAAALVGASDWVGYGLYLDLIADLRTGQAEHRYPLGDEELRVRHALELAAKGKTVAIVCSGDAQIYALAGLAHELLSADGERAVSDAARRVPVECHPGVSAFQMASAKAGALIGHDFCSVSLSDLLTPREVILARLEAAARGDFVTALYNPRSLRRRDLLDAARDIMLRHRPPETPVIVASNLGRKEERVTVTTLAEFEPETVDMLTIVLIGSTESRAYRRGDGRTYAFTPRGYAAKAEKAETAKKGPLTLSLSTEGRGDGSSRHLRAGPKG